MISEEKVREVAERLSIVEVVSEYVQLRRSGANYLGLCPFHSEKTPSFNVNPAREIFHCFGCGAGGNVFTFVMKMEGVSFPDSVRLLARKAGVEIEEKQLTESEKQARSERQTFQKINDLAARYYRNNLESSLDGKAAREYLKVRFADGEVAEAYSLGFASDRRDGLAKHLQGQGIDLELALKLGIVRRNEHGWYDLFRNRLIFPIKDSRGAVIAFAGRVLDSSLPKYINSPESPLYHKSSVLFGLDLALPTVRTENSIIIVEGYFDHLALYKAGVRNVAATCGTALTASHATLIKRHASKVYTLFDSDSAGRKATIKAMELFMEQRLPAYVISLPAGDDPDSFLAKNPAESFMSTQLKARPAFDFYLRSLLQQTAPDSVDSKVRIIDEIIPRFRKIADPVERDLYEKEICRLLGITVHAFRKRLGGMAVVERDMQVSSRVDHKGSSDNRQEMLLALIAGYPDARTEIRALGIEKLFDGAYLSIAGAMLTALSDDDNPQQLSRLLENMEDQDQKVILSRLLVSDAHFADINWRDVLRSCQTGMEKKVIRLTNKEIAARLAVLDPDSEEYAELLQQGNALCSRKSKL